MASKHDFHKVIIGRSDSISFIDSDILNVPAKSDTGAYRSAVHANEIFVDHEGVLHFTLLGGHPVCGPMSQALTAKIFKRVSVANSFGHVEDRYEVKLKVKLGPKIFTSHFTLADRSKKIYPILLGRKLLSHRFIVDTSHTGLSRAEIKERYGIDFPVDEEEGRNNENSNSL